MKKVYLLFGIHNHQPVGNFDDVFNRAFTTAYKPFITTLEKHPAIKTSLHYSGSLLEWIESEEPSFFERIFALVDKKQIELLGGGFYDPILPILKERDMAGQLSMMRDFIQKKFNTTPKGCWLTERVWDPMLPRIMHDQGLHYTLLDSTHFLYSGLSPERVHGYYVTERDGKTLALFPIDMKLRYTIPFEAPEKTIEYLRYFASDDKDIAVTYGDDGEKFGMWPGTSSWVFDKGWLEQFFSALEKNRDMIEMLTFSEYLTSHRPEGTIFLPALSYEEMMKWSLPTDAAIQYEDMEENFEKMNILKKYRSFIRGGFWNNFLVKYPESNRMHKKMYMVSDAVEKIRSSMPGEDTNKPLHAAQKELYRGQCNCAYWHGLYGGIYLNYLRHAVYRHLINAEKIIDSMCHTEEEWIHYKLFDFKKDLSQDIIISGKNLNAFFSPANGGTLFELDFKPRSFNIANTLSRRMEGYHRKLKIQQPQAADNRANPVSIHHISKVKDTGLQDRIIYDWYERCSFIDHFLGKDTTLDGFFQSRYPESGSFVGMPYLLKKIKKKDDRSAICFCLEREGHILHNDQQMPLCITKCFTVNDTDKEIVSSYTIANRSNNTLDVWFGIEFNVTLLAGSDPSRYYRFPGNGGMKYLMNTTAADRDIAFFEMVDEWNSFCVKLSFSPAADIWRFPIETISRSEDGIEKTYQGSTVLAHWGIRLGKEQAAEKTITLSLFTTPGSEKKGDAGSVP